MGGRILNKPSRKREFFRFRFLRPKLPFLVLFWFWDVKRKPELRTREA